uniref:Uncharacterized protein n=1 Tax=Anguilla anguilla TaxID=7936 RepID=A0A0E9VN82_ANGAN
MVSITARNSKVTSSIPSWADAVQDTPLDLLK